MGDCYHEFDDVWSCVRMHVFELSQFHAQKQRHLNLAAVQFREIWRENVAFVSQQTAA